MAVGEAKAAAAIVLLFSLLSQLPRQAESAHQAFRRDPGHPQWHHGAFHDVRDSVRSDVHRMLHSCAEVKKMVLEGQEVVILGGSYSLHRHEKLAIAVSKAMRGHSLKETKKDGRYHVHTKIYLDGAMLIEEMELSAEMKLLSQQRDLQAKIPDIEKCLDVVSTFQEKKDSGEEVIADFEVSEGIYSRARIQDMESVCLWLGANVMLEYSLEEAMTLCPNAVSISFSLSRCKYCQLMKPYSWCRLLLGDLQFLHDQVTITQVTIACIYNWDVRQRRIRQPSGTPKDS